jgi:hypothetical protein
MLFPLHEGATLPPAPAACCSDANGLQSPASAPRLTFGALTDRLPPPLIPRMADFDQRPPLHRAWYLVAFVVVAFVAGLVIKWYRTGAIYP